MRDNYINNEQAGRHSPAFSLIELLSVIAILGLLMAAAVPIFKDSSSSARQASVEIIKAHMQQAKAHAISSGSAAAVVIPILTNGGELGSRALSVVEVTKKAGVYVPAKDAAGKDLLLQRWRTLPGNFHFIPSSSISSSKLTVVDHTETMNVVFGGKTTRCHMIVFAPSGQIVLPSTEPHVAIAKAVNRANRLTFTEKAAGRPVHEIFRVNRLTGRTRVIEAL